MANGYMPRKDADALAYMKNFAAVAAAHPERYFMVKSDADAINRCVDDFEQAYFAANDQSTRTSSAVNLKNQTRTSAEQLIAGYYNSIKQSAGISDQSKIAIGVRPVNRGRRRITCPQSEPSLNILGNTPGQQVLKFCDRSVGSEHRGKPFGAKFIELRVAVGDDVIRDVEQARPVGLFTASRIAVKFDHSEDRKKATYFGRWVSARGETGPWSNPVSMSIAA
jgi:hypothetical protein